VNDFKLWTGALYKCMCLRFDYDKSTLVSWWHSSQGVGLLIKRSWIRLPAGAQSCQLGKLSLPSPRGR